MPELTFELTFELFIFDENHRGDRAEALEAVRGILVALVKSLEPVGQLGIEIAATPLDESFMRAIIRLSSDDVGCGASRLHEGLLSLNGPLDMAALPGVVIRLETICDSLRQARVCPVLDIVRVNGRHDSQADADNILLRVSHRLNSVREGTRGRDSLWLGSEKSHGLGTGVAGNC